MVEIETSRDEMLIGVLIGAVEGGTGYWAQCSGYRYDTDLDSRGVTLYELTEDEDDYKEIGVRITLYSIEQAMEEIASKSAAQAGKKDYAWPGLEMRKQIAGALKTGDASHLDADYADVIVQVAMLGEVVYG